MVEAVGGARAQIRCVRALGLTIGRFKTERPRESTRVPSLHARPSHSQARTRTYFSSDISARDDVTLPAGLPNPIYPIPDEARTTWRPQLPCYLVHTNARTHDVIRANLDRSPLFNGTIEGIGPRYCPSIEDKVVRFADKERHQVFLEPEGWRTGEVYVQGMNIQLARRRPNRDVAQHSRTGARRVNAGWLCRRV